MRTTLELPAPASEALDAEQVSLWVASLGETARDKPDGGSAAIAEELHGARRGLTDVALGPLATALCAGGASLSRLRHLDLSGNLLSDSGCVMLAECCVGLRRGLTADFSGLQSLVLTGNEISRAGAVTIAEGFFPEGLADGCKDEFSLSLSGNPIGDGGVAAIARIIKTRRCRAALGLSEVGCSSAGCSALVEGLPWIVALNLDYNTIPAGPLLALANAVKEPLQRLSLAGVVAAGGRGFFRTPTTQALGHALSKTGASLRVLGVARNDLQDDGVKPFLDALQECTSPLLEEIDLSGNRLKDGNAIAKVLASSGGQSLRAIMLESNELNDLALIALAAGLAMNPSLKVLKMARNRFGDTGATALAEALRHQGGRSRRAPGGAGTSASPSEHEFATWLQELGCSSSCAGDGTAGRWTEPGVQYLDVSFNMVSDEGACALASAAKARENLRQILLYETSVGAEGRSALEAAMQASHVRVERAVTETRQAIVGGCGDNGLSPAVPRLLPRPLIVQGLELEPIQEAFAEQARAWSFEPTPSASQQESGADPCPAIDPCPAVESAISQAEDVAVATGVEHAATPKPRATEPASPAPMSDSSTGISGCGVDGDARDNGSGMNSIGDDSDVMGHSQTMELVPSLREARAAALAEMHDPAPESARRAAEAFKAATALMLGVPQLPTTLPEAADTEAQQATVPLPSCESMSADATAASLCADRHTSNDSGHPAPRALDAQGDSLATAPPPGPPCVDSLETVSPDAGFAPPDNGVMGLLNKSKQMVAAVVKQPEASDGEPLSYAIAEQSRQAEPIAVDPPLQILAPTEATSNDDCSLEATAVVEQSAGSATPADVPLAPVCHAIGPSSAGSVCVRKTEDKKSAPFRLLNVLSKAKEALDPGKSSDPSRHSTPAKLLSPRPTTPGSADTSYIARAGTQFDAEPRLSTPAPMVQQLDQIASLQKQMEVQQLSNAQEYWPSWAPGDAQWQDDEAPSGHLKPQPQQEMQQGPVGEVMHNPQVHQFQHDQYAHHHFQQPMDQQNWQKQPWQQSQWQQHQQWQHQQHWLQQQQQLQSALESPQPQAQFAYFEAHQPWQPQHLATSAECAVDEPESEAPAIPERTDLLERQVAELRQDVNRIDRSMTASGLNGELHQAATSNQTAEYEPEPESGKGAAKGKGPPLPAPLQSPETQGKAMKGAPPPGKGKGKAPAPPMPKGLPFKVGAPKGQTAKPGKGKGKGENGEARAGGDGGSVLATSSAPFNKKLYWKPLDLQDSEGTIFGGERERTKSLLDTGALAKMFEAEKAKDSERVRRSTTVLGKAQLKVQGIKLLSDHRARNVAIVLKRMPCTMKELIGTLRGLGWEAPGIGTDDLEQILEVIPSQDEADKLREYKAPEARLKLRDVEQLVLPLALLSRASARVRLVCIARGARKEFGTCMRALAGIRAACNAIHRSAVLREVMLLALDLGNYINHGDSSKGAKAITIGSLLTLKDFKAGKNTALHFLCASMLRSQPDRNVAEVLAKELRSVVKASQLQVQILQSQVRCFARDVEVTNAECRNFLHEYATAASAIRKDSGDSNGPASSPRSTGQQNDEEIEEDEDGEVLAELQDYDAAQCAGDLATEDAALGDDLFDDEDATRFVEDVMKIRGSPRRRLRCMRKVVEKLNGLLAKDYAETVTQAHVTLKFCGMAARRTSKDLPTDFEALLQQLAEFLVIFRSHWDETAAQLPQYLQLFGVDGGSG